MNQPGEQFGRLKNDQKVKMYLRDAENTVTYQPQDYTGNKFFGSWNKVFNMKNLLLIENREKYLNELSADSLAQIELESVPICFNQCIQTIDDVPGLDVNQKTCLRDCYLKRTSVRSDLNMYVDQKLTILNVKDLKDQFI